MLYTKNLELFTNSTWYLVFLFDSFVFFHKTKVIYIITIFAPYLQRLREPLNKTRKHDAAKLQNNPLLPLQNLHRNPRTRLCIREGVVVVRHPLAAGRRHGVQLMVGELLPEMAAGGATSAVELVVGVVHLIDLEHRSQTAFVKRTVVRHQRQPLNQRFNLPPYVGEHRRVVSVLVREAVRLLTEPSVVIGRGFDEAVERVCDVSVAYDNNSHAAHAAAFSVGGFEIDGGEVGHFDGLFIINLTLTLACYISTTHASCHRDGAKSK